SGEHVQHFDYQAEVHREVDVAALNVLAHAVGDQHHADQQQERERQHLHCRKAVDEANNDSGKSHHEDHNDDQSSNHHPQCLGHAHGGDDRIQREDDVDSHDLRDHHADAGMDGAARPGSRFAFFDLMMDLDRRLGDQEQPAAEQNEVLAGELMVEG